MALLTDGQSVIDATGPGADALLALGWTVAGDGAVAKTVTNAHDTGLHLPQMQVMTKTAADEAEAPTATRRNRKQ